MRPRVLALPLREVSARVRIGAPVDDEADLVWADVLPLRLALETPGPSNEDLRPAAAGPVAPHNAVLNGDRKNALFLLHNKTFKTN